MFFKIRAKASGTAVGFDHFLLENPFFQTIIVIVIIVTIIIIISTIIIDLDLANAQSCP